MIDPQVTSNLAEIDPTFEACILYGNGRWLAILTQPNRSRERPVIIDSFVPTFRFPCTPALECTAGRAAASRWIRATSLAVKALGCHHKQSVKLHPLSIHYDSQATVGCLCEYDSDERRLDITTRRRRR